MINNLKLDIIGYYESILDIIFVVGFFVATGVPVHAGLGVDSRIHTASRFLPVSRRLWLGVLIRLEIRFFKLQARTARWPYWLLRFLFIRRVHATTEWRCVGVKSTRFNALRRRHPGRWRDRSLKVVAGDNSLNDVTHFDGATWSRGGLPLRHQELVAMELTVGVTVVDIVKSEGASLLHDSSVLSCQLSLILLISTWSNHDDHLITGRRLFGLGHPHRFDRVVFERVGVRILFAIKQVRKENALVVVWNKPTLLHVHFVDGVQLVAGPLVREYLFLPLAKHGQVSVVRNVLERRPSDALAHLLGRKPRLGVTDDSVADLNGVHFGLESNKLDDRFALRLVV